MNSINCQWMMAILVTIGVVSAILITYSSISSFTSDSNEDIACSSFGGGPPFSFQTYEATEDRLPYLTAQKLAAQNLLFPNDPKFAFNELLLDPINKRQPSVQPMIPVQLIHAIGWIESRLVQADSSVPYKGIGNVLVSSSCAYGLMQIASSFNNTGGIPTRAETLAGTHYAYNIASGIQILAEKWNSEFFPAVGKGNNRLIESWYYATWAYNGWSLSNHPAGAEVDPFRSLPYDCEGPYNNYAYQELVFGCISSPPSIDNEKLWESLSVELPDLATFTQPNGPLHPDAYFSGWSTVFATPATNTNTDRPFADMDLPAPSASIVPPQPNIPQSSATTMRVEIMGEPLLDIDQIDLELHIKQDISDRDEFTIRNKGTGLLIYRIVPQQDWIEVSPIAGVAAGHDVPLSSNSSRDALIVIKPKIEGLPEGRHEGIIMVEALLQNGAAKVMKIFLTVDKISVAQYEAGTPLS